MQQKNGTLPTRQRRITQAQRAAAISLTVLLGIVLLVLFTKKDDNNFSYTVRGKDFGVNGDVVYNAKQGYDILTVEETQNDEVFLGKENLVLEPGTYSYDFQYSLSGAPMEWSIYSGNYLSSDNVCGKVFWEQTLNPGSSEATGTFEVDQRIEDFGIRIELAKGAKLSVSRFTFRSDTIHTNDPNVFMMLAIIAYVILLWLAVTKKQLCQPAYFRGELISGRRMCFLLVLIMGITTIYVSAPLFASDLSGGYDLIYHANRIEGLAKSLACGQFPVRVHSGILNGYGYTNSIFYPELFLYFPAGLRLLGMSLMNCYKVFAIVSSFATVAIAYIAFSKLFSSRCTGLMAAILYTLSPYRIACIYERSAVGEYLAMTFLPAVFYGIYAIFFGKKDDWKWLCLGATGVLQSHILTTEITAFFCAILALVFVRRLFWADKRWVSLLKATIWTILLNLWFLVPFVLMALQLNISVFTRNPQLSINAITSVHELFSMSYLRQLRINGSGVASNGLGIVFLLALALFLLYVIIANTKKQSTPAIRKLLGLGIVCSILISFTVFAATDLFPWEEIQSVHFVSKIVGSLQFPFRLFSVTSICFAVLCGIVLLLWTTTPSQRRVAALAAVLITAFSATIYLDYTITYAPKPHYASQHQLPTQTTTWEGIALGEYVPSSSDVLEIFTRGTNLTPSDPAIKIDGVERNGTSISFDFKIDDMQAGQAYSIIMPLTYYPSFRAVINGTEYMARPGGNNYVLVDLPEAEGHVEVSYRQPLSFVAATAVSAASGIIFCIPVLFPKFKKPTFLK